MTLDVYAGLFGDDLDAVAARLDDAFAARDADHMRTDRTTASWAPAVGQVSGCCCLDADQPAAQGAFAAGVATGADLGQ
jgi:hypothetical protein